MKRRRQNHTLSGRTLAVSAEHYEDVKAFAEGLQDANGDRVFVPYFMPKDLYRRMEELAEKNAKRQAAEA